MYMDVVYIWARFHIVINILLIFTWVSSGANVYKMKYKKVPVPTYFVEISEKMKSRAKENIDSYIKISMFCCREARLSWDNSNNKKRN